MCERTELGKRIDGADERDVAVGANHDEGADGRVDTVAGIGLAMASVIAALVGEDFVVICPRQHALRLDTAHLGSRAVV